MGASVAQTPQFDFHSAFWVNFHHFIRGEARQRIYERSQSQPQSQTSSSEAPAWTEAIHFYDRNLAQRDLLLDETMPPIKNALEDAEDAKDLSGVSIPPDLKKVLEAAARTYSDKFWKDQDDSNRKWISDVSPLAAKFGPAIAKRIAALYKAKWPKTAVRVDLVETAGPNGAYTTVNDNGQPRVTISSYAPALSGYYALEMLFHESSHAWGKMLFDSLEAAATRVHGTLPAQFWHLVLFYTAGEVTRAELSRGGIKDYIPYADQNDVYKRVCPSCREIIAREWQPYMDGKIDFDTAIIRLVGGANHK